MSRIPRGTDPECRFCDEETCFGCQVMLAEDDNEIVENEITERED